MIDPNSKTARNLAEAFAGESQARNKYTYFAEAARREGLDSCAELFEKLSRNEQQHAKFWFEALNGPVGDTVENLKAAIEGEHYEWSDMYLRFALDAQDEGYSDIARVFEAVSGIERNHEEKFKRALAMLRGEEGGGTAQTAWVCRICGHVVYADEMPDECVVCGAEGQFERE